MNNFIKFSALIFTLVLFLASCNSKVEDLKPVQLTTESVFITGKILNPTPENNTITVYENDILSGDQISHSSLVDNSGDFQMKLNLYNSKDVLVRYGNNSFPLIVHPNDSIHIVFDADKISDKDKLAKTIQFSGSAAVENSKLIAFHSEISKISIPLQQYRQYEKEKYPTDFIAIPDSLRTVRKEVANEFIQQGVSNELKEWIKNDVDFDYYNWLARYPQNHARFNKLDKDTVVPSSFYDFMNIEVSREYLHNSKFVDFVSRYRFGRINAFSKKLMNEINSDKVDFVYLCTDSNEDRWKALISELEIEGSHYLATPDQSRFIYELFEMYGVP